MGPFTSSHALTYGALARFVHTVEHRAAAELASFDLTPAQFQMLVQIQLRPGVAQWQLADQFGVTKGNVSQLIRKLEFAGLIVRLRNQGTDELSLSPTGDAVLGEVVPAHDAFMDRAFAGLSGSELDQLRELVQKLTP